MTKADRLAPLRIAARELDVPATWLRREADAGAIPCLRAGNVLLFDLTHVRQLLLERARQTPTGEEDPAAAPKACTEPAIDKTDRRGA